MSEKKVIPNTRSSANIRKFVFLFSKKIMSIFLIISISTILLLVFLMFRKDASQKFDYVKGIVDTAIPCVDAVLFNKVNEQIFEDLEKYPRFTNFVRENKYRILPFNPKPNDVNKYPDLYLNFNFRTSGASISKFEYVKWGIDRIIFLNKSRRLSELKELFPKEIFEKYFLMDVVKIKIHYKLNSDSSGNPIVEITNCLEKDLYGFNRQYIELLSKMLSFCNIKCIVK